jgi:hypothetical protein
MSEPILEWYKHPDFLGLCDDVADTLWQKLQQQNDGSVTNAFLLSEVTPTSSASSISTPPMSEKSSLVAAS